MILVRSPLRITLGGGGTDLPSYYRAHGGFTVSAAINKYVYIGVVNPFTDGMYIKAASIEECHKVDDIHHPLIRECLKMMGVDRVALTTFADIPAGTGLGSSGAFTCALLKALAVYTRRSLSTHDLASLACEVELYKVGDLGGKQDQFTSAYGGVNAITFDKYDGVKVDPINLTSDTLTTLEDHLVMYYTGLDHQSSVENTPLVGATGNLDEVKALGYASKGSLESGDLTAFAKGLSSQWEAKGRRAPYPHDIEMWYNTGLLAGALGGKLVGSGGGGFLLFYTERPDVLRDVMSATGLVETRFHLDFEGTQVVTT